MNFHIHHNHRSDVLRILEAANCANMIDLAVAHESNTIDYSGTINASLGLD